MDKSKIEKFNELNIKIAELEKERDEVKTAIKVEMEAEEIDTAKTDYGTFYFTTRKTYKFSDDLTAQEKAVKEEIKAITEESMKPIVEKKEIEIEEGVAELSESKSLAFRKA